MSSSSGPKLRGRTKHTTNGGATCKEGRPPLNRYRCGRWRPFPLSHTPPPWIARCVRGEEEPLHMADPALARIMHLSARESAECSHFEHNRNNPGERALSFSAGFLPVNGLPSMR